MKTCDICGNEVEYLTIDYDKSYCNDCWCETHSICADCGVEFLDKDLFWSDRALGYVCDCCYNEIECEENEDDE